MTDKKKPEPQESVNGFSLGVIYDTLDNCHKRLQKAEEVRQAIIDGIKTILNNPRLFTALVQLRKMRETGSVPGEYEHFGEYISKAWGITEKKAVQLFEWLDLYNRFKN